MLIQLFSDLPHKSWVMRWSSKPGDFFGAEARPMVLDSDLSTIICEREKSNGLHYYFLFGLYMPSWFSFHIGIHNFTNFTAFRVCSLQVWRLPHKQDWSPVEHNSHQNLHSLANLCIFLRYNCTISNQGVFQDWKITLRSKIQKYHQPKEPLQYFLHTQYLSSLLYSALLWNPQVLEFKESSFPFSIYFDFGFKHMSSLLFPHKCPWLLDS